MEEQVTVQTAWHGQANNTVPEGRREEISVGRGRERLCKREEV